MRQIADFHIHSRFSRACSKELTLPNLEKTGREKGVDIIATGDFTYPEWFKEIRESLTAYHPAHNAQRAVVEETISKRDEGRLYVLKSAADDKIKFMLSTEFALIYKKYDKVRRIHIVVMAPNIEAATELNSFLDKRYNIRSDGRPILGMSADDLCELCFSIHPKFLVYPAHIWTPWFSVFGSKSGFNTMEECFGDFTERIYAYETGLSSDPEMNWRLSALDRLTLLSNSDAHSLPNLGREANVFELTEVSYDGIYDVITRRDAINRVSTDSGKSYLDYTIEFYPEEGMYHYDGHRACGLSCTPAETKKYKGICPVCKKPLVIGVMSRVEELADRAESYRPEDKPAFRKMVELDKIIADAMGIRSRTSVKVRSEYKDIVRQAGTEMAVLLDLELDTLGDIAKPEIVEGIRRVRAGTLHIEPGFDGQYGVVRIFKEEERRGGQKSLV